jgi:hypothetical protein
VEGLRIAQRACQITPQSAMRVCWLERVGVMQPPLRVQVQSWLDVDTGPFMRHGEDANHDEERRLIQLRAADLDVVGAPLDAWMSQAGADSLWAWRVPHHHAGGRRNPWDLLLLRILSLYVNIHSKLSFMVY